MSRDNWVLIKLHEAEKMFDLGELKKCVIHQNNLLSGYSITFRTGNHRVILLDSQRDSQNYGRLFKTVDAAWVLAKKIGFKDVELRDC